MASYSAVTLKQTLLSRVFTGLEGDRSSRAAHQLTLGRFEVMVAR